MHQIAITVGDKQLLEEGIESIADELRAAFATYGRSLEVTERFVDDDVHEVTIGAETVVIADWSDESFDMDRDLPLVGGGTLTCRTHLEMLIRPLRTALGALPDGATWQLSNIDEYFTLFVATRAEIESAATSAVESAEGVVFYDFD